MSRATNGDGVATRIAASRISTPGRLTAVASVVPMGLLTASEAQPASAPVAIHDAFPSKNAAFWPNFVATSLGLYAKEGVEVQPVIVDPNVTVSALMGGSVEIFLIGRHVADPVSNLTPPLLSAGIK
jgi:ABC-type nitrate/sulfonate/bicarbonate transport system substrate-binding protein